MALPASGAISLRAIATELGKAAGSAITLNDGDVRTLLGKATGAISIADAYGKSNTPAGTYSMVAGQVANSGNYYYGWDSAPLVGIMGSITPTPVKTTAGGDVSTIITYTTGGIWYLMIFTNGAVYTNPKIVINGIRYTLTTDSYFSNIHEATISSNIFTAGQTYGISLE